MSHWTALTLCVVANVGCNIAFKRLVDSTDGASFWRLNGGVLGELALWIGLLLAGLALAGYLYAIRIVPLSIAYAVVTSVSIVLLALAGSLFLNESISIKQIAGFSLIIVGISLVYQV